MSRIEFLLKKVIYVSLASVCLQSQLLVAQSTEFSPVGAVWTYEQADCDLYGCDYTVSTVKVINKWTSGDTTFTQLSHDAEIRFQIIPQQDTLVTLASIGDTVWFLDLLGTNDHSILYVFNDRVKFEQGISSNYDTRCSSGESFVEINTVDSIDTDFYRHVVYSDSNSAEYCVSNYSNAFGYGSIEDNIFSGRHLLFYPFIATQIDGRYFYELLCYYDDEIGQIYFRDSTCSVITSVDDVHPDPIEISISPNPATSSTSIAIDMKGDKLSTVFAMDATGHNIFRYDRLDGQESIVVSFSQPGFYFIGLITSDGHYVTKQIVVN